MPKRDFMSYEEYQRRLDIVYGLSTEIPGIEEIHRSMRPEILVEMELNLFALKHGGYGYC